MLNWKESSNLPDALATALAATPLDAAAGLDEPQDVKLPSLRSSVALVSPPPWDMEKTVEIALAGIAGELV